MNICNLGLSTIVYGNAVIPTDKKKKEKIAWKKRNVEKIFSGDVSALDFVRRLQDSPLMIVAIMFFCSVIRRPDSYRVPQSHHTKPIQHYA